MSYLSVYAGGFISAVLLWVIYNHEKNVDFFVAKLAEAQKDDKQPDDARFSSPAYDYSKPKAMKGTIQTYQDACKAECPPNPAVLTAIQPKAMKAKPDKSKQRKPAKQAAKSRKTNTQKRREKDYWD